MKKKQLLMIFIKNPKIGTVITRLAECVGDIQALRVYKKLMNYTLVVIRALDVKRQIWYSTAIDPGDGIDAELFEKHLQDGENLGVRMKNAFEQGFKEGYEQIVIIGSDCPGLTEEILEEAFSLLNKTDVVLGPSEDGGYYLLGMKTLIPRLFSGIRWSTDSVYPQSLNILHEQRLAYEELPVLIDIDTEEDLRNSGF